MNHSIEYLTEQEETKKTSTMNTTKKILDETSLIFT